ncbi:hypothetical protein F2P79_000607 [Pimephales promelas]|nr:hypothetical protein F2P79_000607 [Pimephales promelas]
MPDIGCKPAVHQRPRGRFVMTEGILGECLGKSTEKVSIRLQSSSFVTLSPSGRKRAHYEVTKQRLPCWVSATACHLWHAFEGVNCPEGCGITHALI